MSSGTIPFDPAAIPLTQHEWKQQRTKHVERIKKRLKREGVTGSTLERIANEQAADIDNYVQRWEQQVTDIASIPIEERIAELGRQEAPIEFFAIDGKGSRDRDDAIAVERHEDGSCTYHVAVSDVASVIEKDSSLDQRAMSQAVTRYHTSPPQNIFGRKLSEQYLSLASHPNPAMNDEEVDFLHADDTRPNLLLISSVTLDQDGRVLRSEMSRGWGRIHRISKTAAGKWLSSELDQLERQDNDTSHLPSKPIDMPDARLYSVDAAMRLANLRASLAHGGGIEPLDIEASLVTNEDGKLHFTGSGKATATLLIQEMMLQANQQTARIMQHAGLPYAFRNHSVKLRYQTTADKQWHEETVSDPQQISSIIAKQEGGAIDHLRIMPNRAEVTSHMEFHMGLSMPTYAWWTSPIRRYADLINQRMTHYVLDVIEELKAYAPETEHPAFYGGLWQYAPPEANINLSIQAEIIFNICRGLPDNSPLCHHLTEELAQKGWNDHGQIDLTVPLYLADALEGAFPHSAANIRRQREALHNAGTAPIATLMRHVMAYSQTYASAEEEALKEFLLEHTPLGADQVEQFIEHVKEPPYTYEQIDNMATIFNARLNKAKAQEAQRDKKGDTPYDSDLSLLMFAFPDTDAARLQNPLEYPYKATGFSKLLQAAMQEVGPGEYNEVIAEEFKRRMKPDEDTKHKYPHGKLHARDYFMILTHQDTTPHQGWQALKLEALEFLHSDPDNAALLDEIMLQFTLPLQTVLPLHEALPRMQEPTAYEHVELRQQKIVSQDEGRSLQAAIVVYQKQPTDKFTVASNHFSVGKFKQNIRRQAVLEFLDAIAHDKGELLDESAIPPELWDGKTKHLRKSLAHEDGASEQRLMAHVHHLIAMVSSDIEHLPEFSEDEGNEFTQERIMNSLLYALGEGGLDYMPQTLDEALGDQPARNLYGKLATWLKEEYVQHIIRPMRSMHDIVDYKREAYRLANALNYGIHEERGGNKKQPSVTLKYRPFVAGGSQVTEEVITVTDVSKTRAMHEAYKQLVDVLCERQEDMCAGLDHTLPTLAQRSWQGGKPVISPAG